MLSVEWLRLCRNVELFNYEFCVIAAAQPVYTQHSTLRHRRNHSTLNIAAKPQPFNIQHSTLNIQHCGIAATIQHSTLRQSRNHSTFNIAAKPQPFNTQHSTLNILLMLFSSSPTISLSCATVPCSTKLSGRPRRLMSGW